jgi:hypothetical protein
MDDFNENLEKIKTVAKDAAQKIKDNETVKNVTETIAQNEHVQKINNGKYTKLIKIGAGVLAVVLVFSIFSAIVGDKKAKRAEEQIIEEYTEMLEDMGAKKVDIDADLIAKNKDANLYCFDTNASCKYEGKNREQDSFVIVYSDGDTEYLVVQYEYNKENKSIKKELALAALVRG